MWTRVVWIEGDVEEEGVVPDTWVVDQHVLWPPGSSAVKAMKEKRQPTEKWIKFPLVKIKISSENKKECEDFNETTTAEFSDEEEDLGAKRKVKRKRYENYITESFGDTEQSEIEEERPNKQSRCSSEIIILPDPPQRNSRHGKITHASVESSSHHSPLPPTSRHHSPSPLPTRRDHSPIPPTSRYRSPSPLPTRCRSPIPSTSTCRHRSPSTLPTRRDHSPITSTSRYRSPSPLPTRRYHLPTPSTSRHRSPSPLPTRRYHSPIPSTSRHRSPSPLPTRSTHSHSSRHSPSLSTSTRRTSSPKRSRSNSARDQSADIFPMSEAKFQKRTLHLLTEIRNTLQQIGKKYESADSDIHIEQCSSLEEFQALDGTLGQPEKCQLLVSQLSQVGGVSVKDNVSKIMQRVMTNEVMSQMNMKGNKGKVAFKETVFFKVVVASVLKNQTATESDVASAITSCLKYAPDRKGGGGRK